MITDYCATRTVTEIAEDRVKISCSAQVNQDGIERPTLFRTDILQTPSEINRVSGLEGELLVTHSDSNKDVATLNKDGEMIINLEDDDANKYIVNDKGELIYNE